MQSRVLSLLFSILPTFIVITGWVLVDSYFWTQDGVVGPFSYLTIMFLSALISPFIVIYGSILATVF